MAKNLTVNGTTFEYPSAGDNPGWGEDATAWAEEVTDVLDTLLGTNDITQTTFTIANNQASVANVNGLLFNTSIVRSAEVEYSVYRRTDSVTSGNAESGVIRIVYDNSAVSGQKWSLTQIMNGDAGVVFSVTDAGQFQYTSSNILGANYVGTMKFTAKTLEQ